MTPNGISTLTNITLITPTIADFTNAQHDHGDADDAGQFDHGNLTGQADDDHTQYLNTARHDITARHPDSILFSSTWADYAGTSTIVGWSSFTTKWIYTKKMGKTVFVAFYIEGTSDAVTATFTVPWNNHSIATLLIPVLRVEDNSVTQTLPGLLKLDINSNIVQSFKDLNSTAFTIGNNKRVMGQFWYESA